MGLAESYCAIERQTALPHVSTAVWGKGIIPDLLTSLFYEPWPVQIFLDEVGEFPLSVGGRRHGIPEKTGYRLLVERQGSSLLGGDNDASTPSKGIAQFDETIGTEASNVDRHHLRKMNGLEDFNVHEPVPGGIGAHLYAPIPESAHCWIDYVPEKPLNVGEI